MSKLPKLTLEKSLSLSTEVPVSYKGITLLVELTIYIMATEKDSELEARHHIEVIDYVNIKFNGVDIPTWVQLRTHFQALMGINNLDQIINDLALNSISELITEENLLPYYDYVSRDAIITN